MLKVRENTSPIVTKICFRRFDFSRTLSMDLPSHSGLYRIYTVYCIYIHCAHAWGVGGGRGVGYNQFQDPVHIFVPSDSLTDFILNLPFQSPVAKIRYVYAVVFPITHCGLLCTSTRLELCTAHVLHAAIKFGCSVL